MQKVFIDGREGTTGLRIQSRLESRSDIELLIIPEDKRKDPAERKKYLNACDIAFLCLPDAAAIEAVGMIENESVRVIDASTAHRTNPAWVYGFPELFADGQAKLQAAKRVAVPGCHASGFNALVYPLVESGVLPKEYPIACHSLTGYSGGGKKMIAEYEGEGRDIQLDSPRIYGLTQQHKHLPEMQAVPGLAQLPIFVPVVGDYYSGMLVTIPLHSALLNGATLQQVAEVYRNKYANCKMVSYLPFTESFLSSNALSGKDTMQISVFGNDDRILVAARFDNLGKGASGAAVQCMNIMMGVDETTGLAL